jgi:hypothetical protein
MSEFFLVCGRQPRLEDIANVEVVRLSQAEEIVTRAAHELFSPSEWADCWYLRDRRGCADTLFTEAQAALLDSVPFESTRLYRVFSRVLPTARKIALWYGNDWENLTRVHEAGTFIDFLKRDMESPTAESWLLFESG